jgi:hypothetical protein
MYKRRMTKYSKDCLSSENIGRRMETNNGNNKTARTCLGTKNKTKKKKGLYI